MQKVRLFNIPPEIQKSYNIGSEVEAEADGSVTGGHFIFRNNAGQEVGVDVVELCNTPIMVEDLN